ncbi:MAG: amidohydrolase family protein [Candidatus Binatus sp.]|uniref:N-acyl-D-amino-acid deacylase family protein n=1 Tax=Candidatus Binatus sp. TaxID=2811406 RepID=UPI00271EBA07|nr:amidohydrolase family protein [Candidatus Binatus sp.]MDO8431697.1 amidohydrolase family protein [Candidatus Binatus sp.]
MDYDLVIRNGTVVDGSGAPRVRADVAIAGRRIAEVAAPPDTSSIAAAREIDATGLVIAPGFIDLHSHSDWVVPTPEHGEILKPFLMQGVTTFVGGNCGFSTAPIKPERQRMLDESGRLCAERKFDWSWDTVAGFAGALRRQGLALNVAHLAGHGSIRLSVMGADAGEPSAEQLREMQAMVERAMADGAVGLSTGLGYFPGMIAKPAELASLARVAAAAGGVLTSHLRAYSVRSLFFDSRVPHNILAVREMANVAREAGVPLQVSHLIFVGRRTWETVDETLGEIERHRNDGVDIAFDTFPYTCGNTTIRIIFPAWSQTGLEALLDSKDGWARLKEGFRPLGEFIAESIQLMWAVKPELKYLEGKFFGEIADELKVDPIEAYLTIARESETRGRVLIHLYSGDDADEHALRAAMSHPLNLFEMDTILTSHGHHNPASFGAYPRIMGHYVRQLKLLTLEDAVHKATGMAAKRMRLAGRGIVRRGYAADLVLFNPDTIASGADATAPAIEPIGIEHVLVNGTSVVAEGKWCGDGVRAGEWIARG